MSAPIGDFMSNSPAPADEAGSSYAATANSIRKLYSPDITAAVARGTSGEQPTPYAHWKTNDILKLSDTFPELYAGLIAMGKAACSSQKDPDALTALKSLAGEAWPSLAHHILSAEATLSAARAAVSPTSASTASPPLPTRCTAPRTR